MDCQGSLVRTLFCLLTPSVVAWYLVVNSMPTSLVDKTAAYVRRKVYNDPAGNDWYHIERVLALARLLHKEEGGNLELIELAILLHELKDYKQTTINETKGTLALQAMMDIVGIEDAKQETIEQIIEESRYHGEDTKVPKSIEGKIVQDADWLDSLGAVGIARTFAAGGHINRMLHDPHKTPRKHLSKADYLYRRSEGTSLNYFYEKLLKLPALMNTATAKKMAERRELCIRKFIDEFLAEWEGKY